MRLKLLLTVLAVATAVFVLDRALYGSLIFAHANPSGWDAFPWYNFEYETRSARARRAANPEAPLAVIAGSSISKYAVQRTLLEALLERRLGGAAEVELVQHASLLPADLFYYTDRVRALNPDVVAFLTGPADLDLERYTPPWEAGPDYASAAAERYIDSRLPVRLFYPGAFARDNAWLGLDRRATLLFRSLLYSTRFKSEWYDPLLFRLEWREPLRSYGYYQGERIPEGLYRDGHTSACFTIPAAALGAGPTGGALLLQIPEALAAAGEVELKFYELSAAEASARDLGGDRELQALARALWENQAPEGQTPQEFAAFFEAQHARLIAALARPLDCTPPAGRPAAYVYRSARRGWRTIETTLARDGDRRYFATLNRTLDLNNRPVAAAEQPNFAGRGVRLPGNFGRTALRTDDAYVRRDAWEDRRLLLFNDREYAADYEARLQPDDWRAPQHVAFRQLNYLRLGKYYTNWYDWSETTQATYVKRFIAALPPTTRVVIINNPENPWTKVEYGPRWYQGYLEFYRRLARESGGRVVFLDYSDALPMQRFLDPHHLSFSGMLEMAPRYADALADALRRSPPGEAVPD